MANAWVPDEDGGGFCREVGPYHLYAHQRAASIEVGWWVLEFDSEKIEFYPLGRGGGPVQSGSASSMEYAQMKAENCLAAFLRDEMNGLERLRMEALSPPDTRAPGIAIMVAANGVEGHS